ncbi:DUF202 domain-containing protein [Demequina gelatinilytica]|uniref:DUF202 domain-containing protein n=1 Tax=Demequina gelatinilytica TaxID=1638980 RepID=UPI0007840D47|nr:DUF202 domain-containing protein [Demequina gelatinilytica]
MSAGPVDDGLAAERTRLAWERTALSLAVAGLVGLQVLSSAGPLAVALALLGLVTALVTALGAAARYRRARAHAAVRHVPAAVPVVALGVGALALGAACVAFVLGEAAAR